MSEPSQPASAAPVSLAPHRLGGTPPSILTSGHAHAWSGAAFAAAIADWQQGLRSWQLWGMLGWSELRRRYRRSLLGPFWITLSMAIFIFAIGTVFSQLAGSTLQEFLPYVATGYLAWMLISSFILDGCNVFIAAQPFLRSVRLPLSSFVFGAVWRNLVIFLHNLPVVLIILALLGVWPNGWILMLIPALLANALAGAILALVLGMISARFRDIIPIVGSVTQLLFFLTPVLFHPMHLGLVGDLLMFNPATHFVEIIRASLLGQPPSALSWIAVLGMLAVGTIGSFLMFVRFRARITYWV
jgi:ABC-type polysaccharide/polyol phosphate export permease